MKIRLHERKLIAVGCTFEENDWGMYQFPKVYRMYDGTLAATLHVGEDSSRDYGRANPWFLSRDGGESWEAVKEDLSRFCGCALPDGTLLHAVVPPSINLDEAGITIPKDIVGHMLPSMDYPHPHKAQPGVMPTTLICDTEFGLMKRAYYVDALPDGLYEKAYTMERFDPRTGETERFSAPLDWPYMTVTTLTYWDGKTFLPRPFPYGNLKVAPDGSLWVATYGLGASPKTGGISRYDEAYILRSTDAGRSFRLHSRVPYIPNIDVDPLAYIREGFNEPEIEFMPDGSVIMLMRTCGVGHGGPNFGPLYFTRSTDGGVSWDTPKPFDRYGVLPQMCHLACGVTLAVYGRPGIFVRATSDPSGLLWEAPVEIMTPADRTPLGNAPYNPQQTPFHAWEGSCCNMGLAVLDERRAIISYSDFYTPCEDGVKRKACFTQVVEIEEL